jgi:hypothetical protein
MKRHLVLLALALAVALVAGCKGDDDKASDDGGSGADSDGDTDGDADTGGNAGGDTDADSDGDAESPNIYLYPEKTADVRVTLEPADGTWITTSEPAYGDGWDVTAEPSGLLDGAYDFLFYEATVNRVFQEEKGYAVPGPDVFAWFEANLPRLGLSADETQDFLDYWTAHLPPAACYLVYPQLADRVDLTMGLSIEPAPDSLLRLWLIIRGAAACRPPAPWTASPFDRKGFTVVEWGVVLR